MKELTDRNSKFMANFEKLDAAESAYVRGGKRIPANSSYPNDCQLAF
jgi:hypothetical protein